MADEKKEKEVKEELTEKVQLSSTEANRKKKAEKLLSRLDNPDERTILRIYYMETNNGFLYRWDDVAYHMGYEKRHILRMHGNALNSILKSCH